jgi:hypothetical protein
MRPPADMPVTLNDDGTEDYECKDCPHGIKMQPGIGIIYESEDADFNPILSSIICCIVSLVIYYTTAYYVDLPKTKFTELI